MQRSIVVLLALAAPLLAAPAVDNSSAPPPLDANEARLFAQSLLRTAEEVSQRYVRKVSPKDLLFAALSGLHEEVRQPVPDGLQADLAKVAKDPPEQAVAERILDAECIALIAKIRQGLGDAPMLRKGNDLRVGIQAMARSLDPYSMVVNGDELRRGNGENVNYGFGFELAETGPALVKSVVPGSPAQRGGIRPGDRITHQDGKEVERDALDIIIRGLAANPDDAGGKNVTFTVRRGKAERKVVLTAGYFKAEMVLGVKREADESWNYWLDRDKKIGYARIGSLEHGVAEDLQQALAALKADNMKGFILDMRWSPGGFLNEAILVARLFLKEGDIATVQSRGQDDVPYRAQGDGRYADFPLVVLVNGETSGGAELIVAALQDNKRATIVGQRTFGKASVQTMIALPLPNAGLKLTSGSFRRPNGKTLHRFPDSKLSDDWGVQPEAEQRLPITPDLSRQIRDWYVLQALRPSTCDHVLPLDDPENDPQRQLAIKVVGKLPTPSVPPDRP
jgi:carboxyl-terminal processing protease